MDLEPLLRFWRAHDAAFARVEPSWWGAVVSDARFPRVREANYGRVETRQPVALHEVDEALESAMRRTAAARSHVVVFFPEDQTQLLADASTRGERLAWDLVMEHRDEPPPHGDAAVEEVEAFDEIAGAHRDSLRWFDVTDESLVEELEAMERAVMLAAGRRWFVVRSARGHPVALAGLLVLEGVGYLDHVVTVPAARNRGYASALTARAVSEARRAGADRAYLLAEPDGAAERIYARLGFRPVTLMASWISPHE